VQRIGLYGIDLFLVVLATVLAFLLRDNFAPTADRLLAYLPHLALTALTASVVIPAFGLHRSVWRFSSMADYLYVLAASVVIVLGAVVLGFSLNRMEGVARSIPVLQAIMILLLLVGPRVLMRLRLSPRGRPVQQFSTTRDHRLSLAKPSVLIVGINRLTELYLQSAQDLAPGDIRVAGLIGQSERHAGRLIHRHPVLGTPEQLAEILKNLETHGVVVDRIVVTSKWEALGPEAQAELLKIDVESNIRVDFVAQSLGFDTREKVGAPLRDRSEVTGSPASDPALDGNGTGQMDVLSIGEDERERLGARGYWRLKRAIDVVGALALIVLLAPVMVVAAVLVLLDVGRPILFWQQRPGLGGRPFKLYKFRTMAASHDAHGHRVPDDQRLSGIGRFLRGTRLDELPQLFHILIGQMSFIGPRPLLPVDQPVGYATRLLVRPGLTGWAQVKGGRLVSAEDKAALDVWYVRNAGLKVDLNILWRTAWMVIFGETTNPDAIRKAWAMRPVMGSRAEECASEDGLARGAPRRVGRKAA